jgi:Lon protease-like protein
VEEFLIPQFPLELVLFPGQRLPLHIFEERYKTMIQECLEAGEAAEFGVVMAKENGIVNVGCSAQIVEVTRRYADGRMDIVVTGNRRFEVLFLDESKDYLRAAAQFFEDEDNAVSEELSQNVLELHEQVLRLMPNDSEAPGTSEESATLSFRLAGPLPLDPDFKQLLLLLRSEKERLQRVAEYFRFLLPRLKLATWARGKAGGNGHCRH